MKSGTTPPIKKMPLFLQTTAKIRMRKVMMKNGMGVPKMKSILRIFTLWIKVSPTLGIQGTVMASTYQNLIRSRTGNFHDQDLSSKFYPLYNINWITYKNVQKSTV